LGHHCCGLYRAAQEGMLLPYMLLLLLQLLLLPVGFLLLQQV
jgi:hypothetical protein